MGDGTKFVRPTARYVTVPLAFWQRQWINVLSGSATALLVLLELQGGRRPGDAPSTSEEDHRRYGLSSDTWTRATAELKRHLCSPCTDSRLARTPRVGADSATPTGSMKNGSRPAQQAKPRRLMRGGRHPEGSTADTCRSTARRADGILTAAVIEAARLL